MCEELRDAPRRNKERKEYQRMVDRAFGRDPEREKAHREFLRRAGCDEYGKDLSH